MNENPLEEAHASESILDDSIAMSDSGQGKHHHHEHDHSDSDEQQQNNYEPRISREEIKLHISGTILSMVNVSFEDTQIEAIKHSLAGNEEGLIDEALDLWVDEIMQTFAVSSKDDGLNFEEWCRWFTSLDGVNEMLMTPSQWDQQQKINNMIRDYQ